MNQQQRRQAKKLTCVLLTLAMLLTLLPSAGMAEAVSDLPQPEGSETALDLLDPEADSNPTEIPEIESDLVEEETNTPPAEGSEEDLEPLPLDPELEQDSLEPSSQSASPELTPEIETMENVSLNLSTLTGNLVLDFSNGSLRYSTDGGTNWRNYSGELTLTGSTTSKTVTVQSGTHNLKLDNAGITSTTVSPLAIASGATVNLTLATGTSNTLNAKDAADRAGLQVPAGATLTITSSGTGSLVAQGGSKGAGIGGGSNEIGGTITIEGGEVTATAGTGNGGAGIGGGYYEDGGQITISGGKITAQGGQGGAGIGGGYSSNNDQITISGGKITAQGGSKGAGIGGGSSGASGTITIEGGQITATGGDGEAGIGGNYGGSSSKITITGGTIKATGGANSIGIRLGQGNINNITITGGNIQAVDSTGNAAINPTPKNTSGKSLGLVTITLKDITQPKTVTDINKSDDSPTDYGLTDFQTQGTSDGQLFIYLPADETPSPAQVIVDGISTSYSGIFTDKDDRKRTFFPIGSDDPTINLSTLTEDLELNSDGSLCYKYNGNKIYYTGELTLTGTTTTTNTIIVSSGTHQITLSEASITGSTASPFLINSGGAVNLTLETGTSNALNAKDAADHAGLQVPAGATLTITSSGNGELEATGGQSGAGIGGGSNGSGGTITISGGQITATGGQSGAGIGGGNLGAGGKITIEGGTIKATGNTGAQDIGRGTNASEDTNDQITITGGNIWAFDNSLAPAPMDSSGTIPVTLVQIKLDRVSTALPVNGLSQNQASITYGLNGVTTFTSSGYHLYCYLPANTTPTGVVTDQNTYSGKLGNNRSGTFYIDQPPNPNPQISLGSLNDKLLLLEENQTLFYSSDGGESYKAYAGEMTLSGITSSGAVEVQSGTHAVTLNNAKITSSTASPFSINSGGTVNLTLATGTTNLLSSGVSGNAGLQVPAGATLTIKGNSSGSLTALGGTNAAGIGGGDNGAGGTITIEGGQITATGGQSGAGIGGGDNGAGGQITISGGTIKATGQAVGIGQGSNYIGSDGSVQITGGNIQALNSSGTAAILPAPTADSSGNINLDLVTITLQGMTTSTEVTGLTGAGTYNSSGFNTLDPNKLYLYLPATVSPTGVAVVGADYSGKLGNNRSGTFYPDPQPAEIKLGDLSGKLLLAGDNSNRFYSSDGGNNYIPYKDNLTLKGATSSGTVEVQSGTHAVTLDNASITSSTASPFAIDSGATVKLTLADSSGNTLDGGNASEKAGLQVPYGATLTITSSGSGELTATGGYYEAGIGGGSSYKPSGTITIQGGKVTANGGLGGAGIGGSNYGFGDTITIQGGEVIANGGTQGAGIGGGNCGSGGKITIEGGNIKATGGNGAKDIGHGANISPDGSDQITITGGNIWAANNSLDPTPNNGSDNLTLVQIKLNGVSTALSVDSLSQNQSSIIYGLNGVTTFTSSGYHLYCYLPANTTPSGVIAAQTSYYGKLVSNRSGTFYPNPQPAEIQLEDLSGKLLLAGDNSNRFYSSDGGNNYIPYKDNLTLKGATSSGTVEVQSGTHAVTLDNASITSSTASPFSINSGGAVSLTLSSGTTNTLDGSNASGNAGLGVPDGATLTITSSGSGKLTAKGGQYGAGIGGGSQNGTGGAGGTINIKGGEITATGGVGGVNEGSGAGIGGGGSGSYDGTGGAGGQITITGGTIKATGGITGAGIGGGGGWYGTGGDGGTITITGGEITAQGGGAGSGIGGGNRGNGGTITIKGGTIKATTNEGAGIGGGTSGAGGIITIEGGEVTANGGGGGAGIGSGDRGAGGNIIIKGGEVTANGGGGGAGIGGGNYAAGGQINITGGTIKATGSTRAQDIGHGATTSPYPSDKITITGGNVWAANNSLAPNPTADSSGNIPVTLVQIKLDRVSTALPVDSLIGVSDYGLEGVKTFSSGNYHLYCYLPGTPNPNPTGVVTDQDTYYGKLGNNRSGTFYPDPQPAEIKLGDLSGKLLLLEENQTLFYSSDGGNSYIPYKDTLTLMGSTSSGVVEVQSGTHAVTLDGASITSSDTSPFSINSGGAVSLTLVGNNSLDGSNATSNAGLQVPSGATLTIKGNSSGNLTANGGENAAGIGGDDSEAGGTITISGGQITATGGQSGAGIGGGFYGAGGKITIEGGTIKATGNTGAQDIGHGAATQPSDSDQITITGGNIWAFDNSLAPTPMDSSGTIPVTLVKIKLNGVSTALPVNSLIGVSDYGLEGVKTFSSGNYHLYCYLPGTPNPNPTGVVTDQNTYSGKLSNDRSGTFYPDPQPAEIKLGNLSGKLLLLEENQTLFYSSDGGDSYIPYKDTLTLMGSTSSGTVEVQSGTHAVTLDGASITSSTASPFAINSGGAVSLTLSSGTTNLLSSGASDNAGLGVPDGAALTIKGNSSGSLTALGGANGSGIGGGNLGAGGTITIEGGQITATGGENGSGIGGGFMGKNGGKITISGGQITATGGQSGAGIGGGFMGNGGKITIEGGTIKATGSTGAQDIGLGALASGDTNDQITITGGNVWAVNNSLAPTPTADSSGQIQLELVTITLDSVTQAKAVSSILDSSGGTVKVNGVNYGLKDFQTQGNSSGQLFIYLPTDLGTQSPTKVIAKGTYNGTINPTTRAGIFYQGISLDSATLNLTESLNFIYAATIPAGYSNPYMVFNFRGSSSGQISGDPNSSGQYEFKFSGILPNYMTDKLNAALYATNSSGKLVSTSFNNYSVRTYGQNMLKYYATEDKLVSLVSDLLFYGAKSQLFTDYKINDLATDGVTGLNITPFTQIGDDKNKAKLEGDVDSRGEWKYAGLYLQDSMSMYFDFSTTNSSGLTIEATIKGRTTTFTQSKFIISPDNPGCYRVYLRKILAEEFNEPVTVIFKQNGTKIGQTLTYSVNSYAYSMQNDAEEKFKNIVRAIYNYGASAENYTTSN